MSPSIPSPRLGKKQTNFNTQNACYYKRDEHSGKIVGYKRDTNGAEIVCGVQSV
jgi:hypothetical protein